MRPLLVLASNAFAQPTGRLRAGEEPPRPLRGEIHAIADPAPMRSFKDLCDRADAIVEGVVETDAARMMPARGDHIETDFWITVSRELKGPADTSKIVVSGMGGTFWRASSDHELPVAAARGSIRFVPLLRETSRRASRARPAALPGRFFFGTFKVEGGKIQTFFHDPFEKKFAGLTTDAFAAEIASALKP